MIDMRDSDGMTYCLFCEQCENQFGGKVELFQDFRDRSKPAVSMRSRRLARFKKIHDHGLSARMDAEDKENNELNLIAAQVFADNPQATTEEKMKILKARIELYREGRPVPEP